MSDSLARENTYVVGEVVTVFGRRGGCDVNGSDDKNDRERPPMVNNFMMPKLFGSAREQI